MLNTGVYPMSGPGAGRAAAFAPFLKPPVRFDILSRRVPSLDGAAEERAAIDTIVSRLSELNAYVGDFRAGLKLFEHAGANAAYEWSWGPIACRDAGAALVGFREALKQVDLATKACPSLKRARAGLRQAERRFAASFPTQRAGRNGARGGANGAAAQPAPRRHDDMADAAIAAHVARAGRSVTHASNGRAIRFELSEHALWRLVALRNDAFVAFEEALD